MLQVFSVVTYEFLDTAKEKYIYTYKKQHQIGKGSGNILQKYLNYSSDTLLREVKFCFGFTIRALSV